MPNIDQILALLPLIEDDDLTVLILGYYHEQLTIQSRMSRVRRVPDSFSDSEFRAFFRFSKGEFRNLLILLQFPTIPNVDCGYRVSGEECLMIMLTILAYPSRYCQIGYLFNRSKSAIASIFSFALEHVYEKTRHLLAFDTQRLSPSFLEGMCALNRRKGSLLPDCVGFIDGTVRPICRPGSNQRLFFNGHKRVHALKFQNILMPDGLIAYMDGPYSGNRHDAGLLRDSGLGVILETHLRGVDGRQLCIYGDLAYPNRPYLAHPFKGSRLTDEQELFNSTMAGLRIAVEGSFGKILALFPFVDFKKNIKLGLQPVAKYYMVATVLTNCHTCFYGSQTNRSFSSRRPRIEEYLNLS